MGSAEQHHEQYTLVLSGYSILYLKLVGSSRLLSINDHIPETIMRDR